MGKNLFLFLQLLQHLSLARGITKYVLILLFKYTYFPFSKKQGVLGRNFQLSFIIDQQLQNFCKNICEKNKGSLSQIFKYQLHTFFLYKI